MYMKRKLYLFIQKIIHKEIPILEDETTNSSELSKNIKYKEIKTTYGSILFFCKNENEVPVDIDLVLHISRKFDNIDKNYAEHELLTCVSPGEEVTSEIFMCGVSEEYEKSYVSLDVRNTIETDYRNQIKLATKDTKKNIEVQLKNQSKDKIDNVRLMVVYYDKNKIVDTYHCDEFALKSEAELLLRIQYPMDDDGKKIKFDKYKVYLNQASRINWYK